MNRFPAASARSRAGVALALVATIFGVGGSVTGAEATSDRAAASASAAPCDRNVANLAAKRQVTGACAQAPQGELIWQGKVHLGDEPGIYGDATFAGGAIEFPITLQRTSAPGDAKTVLVVETQDAQNFTGYPGHSIKAILHVVDTTTFKAREVVLATRRLTDNRREVPIDLTGYTGPYFVSVQVRQDETVPPGAQDDFLVTRLSNLSDGFRFFANYGYNVSPYSD
ncbi:hypothetical protein Ssi03_36310 [Sphaerisporangium siamense]|uniref:Uncharacterized protein n=1 Tax=Sphaerisporangium siamense TaxID=795645 RepID=A0A7W7GA94_9ACTN|nr:hypothetical protein [Sphaerisporangium siamense]MBB4701515.1 hypothetical protein [Sphaerisporangium siamense]GII85641.1 hypothetical protein Ssi03_36310 [Sphaerisporangium siamense]